MTELELNIKDYRLTLKELGDLMGEFYGSPLTAKDDEGTITFGFENEDNVEKALKALECFPISGNYDWIIEKD